MVNEMKKISVLVTGANGFIGGHVCRYLLDKGCYVIGLGRHETPLNDVNEYVHCDLSTGDVEKILKKLKVENIDGVIHLAADMRIEPYTVQVVESNCTGTQRLLEFCEKEKIQTFIQLSSLPVIGKPLQHPITESHPLTPPTVYHVTKRMQELLADYAWRKFGLRTISFRISSPIGPGMNEKTILPVFVKKAINNEDLVVYGRGTRKQTYIHVKDIAQAIYKAIDSNAQGVYNLASRNLLSNYELASKCIEVLHSSSKIIYSGIEDPMDDYTWDISLDKIEKDIKYQPEIAIEQGIQELYQHYKI